jgi:methyl-accepting chemotaxis protein
VQFKSNINQLREILPSDNAQRLLNTVTAGMEIYAPARDTAVAWALEGRGEAAYVHLTSDEATAADVSIQSAMQSLQQILVSSSRTTYENNNEATESSNLTTMAVIAAGLIFSVLLTIVISNMISRPIVRLAEAADKLADGDMDISQKDADAKDEVGRLARSFGAIRSAIMNLIAEADMLSESAIEGRLSTRADADKLTGGYKQVIEGVNKTLDAVISPVIEATDVLNEVAQGNLNVSVTGDYMGDHAIIKEALNNTINRIKGYIGEISLVLSEVASGNLDTGIRSEYMGNFIELKNSINRIIETLNIMISDINIAAEQVSSGTRQVSDGSQAISQGATEQASAIEELTATVTEIAAQSRQNALNSNKASELASTAKNYAFAGNEQMQSMRSAMDEIYESAASIGKIIKVIDDIAFQTNILALNAAVEAARAGEHGRGFAVVAEEVRNLAAKSANAAKETTVLIESSIKKTEAGTKTAGETALALKHIVESVEQSVEYVSSIADASSEQATAVAQVDKGIEQLSQVVQTNSATSEQTAAASEELSSQAEMLKEMVGQFRLASSESTESVAGANVFCAIPPLNTASANTLKDEEPQDDGEKTKPEATTKKRSGKTQKSEAARATIILSDSEFDKY